MPSVITCLFQLYVWIKSEPDFLLREDSEDVAFSKVPLCLELNLKVCGLMVPTLLDSGGEISCANEEVVKEIEKILNLGHKLSIIPVPHLKIRGVTSRASPVVYKQAILTIEGLGSIKLACVLIVKGLAKPLILGTDFLSWYPKFLSEAENYLRLMLDRKVVERATSPYVSPMCCVRKKDGTNRNVLRLYQGVKYLTTIDITNAYWQVPLAPGSKQYTGFLFRNQQYVFSVMLFGLCNNVTEFTHCLDITLGEECQQIVRAYIDDILIVSTCFDGHLRHVHIVLEKLQAAGMAVEPWKSLFCRSGVPFIRHVLSSEGIRTAPDKLLAITEFPVPRNVRQLRAFFRRTATMSLETLLAAAWFVEQQDAQRDLLQTSTLNTRERVVAKGRRALGMLGRVLNGVSCEVKEKAYGTMVRPMLEYAAAVWDPYVEVGCKNWKRCRERQQDGPSVMMKEMGWSSLKDRRKVDLLVRIYRVVNEEGGWGGLHCKLSKGVFRGRGNNREKLQRVWRRTEWGRQSMFVSSVREWNVLREELVYVRGVDVVIIEARKLCAVPQQHGIHTGGKNSHPGMEAYIGSMSYETTVAPYAEAHPMKASPNKSIIKHILTVFTEDKLTSISAAMITSPHKSWRRLSSQSGWFDLTETVVVHNCAAPRSASSRISGWQKTDVVSGRTQEVFTCTAGGHARTRHRRPAITGLVKSLSLRMAEGRPCINSRAPKVNSDVAAWGCGRRHNCTVTLWESSLRVRSQWLFVENLEVELEARRSLGDSPT
ncbi:hypothetical protein PR048_011484 [Dryococelus australis]|uniref:Reverse transcriptase domain-containing protein n=1 Tax=Dryococelus australis TaxID=614101 RepID=A0ABQ9HLR0_9NEOP|nr:hypothetical protein PR048_011484 [Dryococelus australis]